jgi:hypothetical protein
MPYEEEIYADFKTVEKVQTVTKKGYKPKTSTNSTKMEKNRFFLYNNNFLRVTFCRLFQLIEIRIKFSIFYNPIIFHLVL